MEELRDFKGVWIPKEIWLNTELSIYEKVIIIEIDSLDNSEKGCFASNEYFGKFLGRSPKTIANILTSLKQRGYIYQCFFDGRNRGLKINKNESRIPDLEKAAFPISGKQNSGFQEHINISNNTNINIKDKDPENKFSEASLKIYNYSLKYFDQDLKPRSLKIKEDWLDTIDKLIRIDKKDPKEICQVIKWARTHETETFSWKDNFLSLPKLRKKNRDNVKYYQVFVIQMKRDEKKKQEEKDNYRSTLPSLEDYEPK